MIRFIKSIWRWFFGTLETIFCNLRRIGIDYSTKPGEGLEVELWPYDLVMEQAVYEMIEDAGHATITLEPPGLNLKHGSLGVVVGYTGKNFEKVKVAYVTLYDPKHPIIKTYSPGELVKVDSPLHFLNLSSRVESILEGMYSDQVEVTSHEVPIEGNFILESEKEVEGDDDDEDGSGGVVH